MAALFGSVGVEAAELVGTQQLFTPRVGPNGSFYIVLQCFTWHKVQAGNFQGCSLLLLSFVLSRVYKQLWPNQTIL